MTEEPRHTQSKPQAFDAVAVNLHQQLKQHQDLLEAEGMIAELGALIYWTDRVAQGKLSARDALDKHGLNDLLSLKRRIDLIGARLDTDVAPDFKNAKRQREYVVAYRELAAAIDFYLWAAHNVKSDAKLKGYVSAPDKVSTSPHKPTAGSRASRQAIVEPLACLLVTLYSLYVKSLHYRWAGICRNSAHAHEVLDSHCSMISHIGDDIAARISELGHSTPGQLRAYAAFAAERDEQDCPDSPTDCVNALIVANQVCMSEARRVFDVARSVRDTETVGLVEPIFGFHGRAIEELRAVRTTTQGQGSAS